MPGSLDGIAVVMKARPVMGASWEAATLDFTCVRIVRPDRGLGRICALERIFAAFDTDKLGLNARSNRAFGRRRVA